METVGSLLLSVLRPVKPGLPPLAKEGCEGLGDNGPSTMLDGEEPPRDPEEAQVTQLALGEAIRPYVARQEALAESLHPVFAKQPAMLHPKDPDLALCCQDLHA